MVWVRCFNGGGIETKRRPLSNTLARRSPRSSINAESKRLHFPETFLHFNNTKLPPQKLRSAQQGRGRKHSKLPRFQAAKLRNHEGLRSGEILAWTAWTHDSRTVTTVTAATWFRFLQISSDHLGSPERAVARLPPKNHVTVSEKAVNMHKTCSRHVTSCHRTAHPEAYQSLPAVNEILC